jgi:hypothetical protein
MRSLSLPSARALVLLSAAVLSSCGAAPPAQPAPPAPSPPPVLAVAVAPGPFAFPERALAARAPAAAPVSLTASDGSGLRLAELNARAVVDDPLALTELHLVFDNPEARTLEGTFSITLPEGAAVSRFAMRVGGAWQEAEVVEKTVAREAYEDFLHRRQDPALLERAAGNQFSARVFPIPARGRKELVVTYAQELGRDRGFVLPLRGLPELGRLSVRVTRAGEKKPAVAMAEERFVPSDDVRLEVAPAERARGLRSGTLAVVRVEPFTKPEPDPLGPTLVLVDTSASRALGLGEAAALAARLARRVALAAGADAALTVACFDQEVAPIFDGGAGAFGAGELATMRGREALGASDLGRALTFAADRAGARGLRRVVLVTDGVPTAGATELAALRSAAVELGRAGVERLDAVAAGGIRDEALLRSLVTAGLPRDGVVVDAAADDATLERRLGQATRSRVDVAVADASWWWPRRLDGLQAGDEVLVYAHLREGAPLSVSIGGVPEPRAELADASRPLLERAIARAKIASLVETEATLGEREDVRRQILALSKRYRVESPYTSLLVLETDRDYERFGIARATSPDLLAVDGERVVLLPRGASPRAGALAGGRPARDASSATARLDAPATRPPEPAVASARGSLWGGAVGDALCFTVRGPREARSKSYALEAHYYARGPMGYGMGKLEIVEHDGKGGLTFEERPFVVMVDKAFVDLGTVER